MINTMEINPEELPALDLFQNCRLCLAKEKVSVDIFSEGHEIRLLYYKIVSCLPVNVTQEDKLPRKICAQCNQKVDDFYQFWTLTARSQKTLLEWVEKRELLPPSKIKTENDVPGQVSFKQEAMDYSDDDNDLDRYDDDNSEEENNVQPRAVVKVCEDGEETASGATAAGPSTATIKSTLEMTYINNMKEDGDVKKVHPNVKLPNGHIQCGMCNRVFPNEDIIERHRETHHSNTNFKCNICGKIFRAKNYLKRHYISHSIAKPFDCNLCDKKLKTKYLLKLHVRRVHDGIKTVRVKNLQCSLCPKAFNSWTLLREHQHEHTGMKSCMCSLCGAMFVTNCNLENHMKYVHGGFKRETETHYCDVCGKSYASTGGFNYHKRTAHGDGRPECHHCGKKVCSKTFLATHIKTHTGEKPFCCEYCGRSFTSKKILVIHVRSHTGESPFICVLCNKSFKQRSALTQHYKSRHPGEKPNTQTNSTPLF